MDKQRQNAWSKLIQRKDVEISRESRQKFELLEEVFIISFNLKEITKTVFLQLLHMDPNERGIMAHYMLIRDERDFILSQCQHYGVELTNLPIANAKSKCPSCQFKKDALWKQKICRPSSKLSYETEGSLSFSFPLYSFDVDNSVLTFSAEALRYLSDTDHNTLQLMDMCSKCRNEAQTFLVAYSNTKEVTDGEDIVSLCNTRRLDISKAKWFQELHQVRQREEVWDLIERHHREVEEIQRKARSEVISELNDLFHSQYTEKQRLIQKEIEIEENLLCQKYEEKWAKFSETTKALRILELKHYSRMQNERFL